MQKATQLIKSILRATHCQFRCTSALGYDLGADLVGVLTFKKRIDLPDCDWAQTGKLAEGELHEEEG